MTGELVLEMRGIRKEFPGVVANDDVDLDIRRGEVHALLGENGAGKSTLMNILYGLYRPDAGEILLHGRPVVFSSARDAIHAGIGMVHQHFMLIPVMTVAENIVLGMEPHHGLLLDERAAEQRVRELSEQYGLAVDPDALVSDITVGQEQRVEILKALYRGADILVLDEPTAVLTPQEARELFAIINSLKADGKSIIFISHKLNEVLEAADRITVLRRGKVIETVPREGATEASLARAMVGREVLLRVEKTPAQPGDVLLSVEDIHVVDDRGIEKVRGISLDVRAGEIVGIAGVDGNGQTELIDAITGLQKIESGSVSVDGRELTDANAREMLDAGVGHIPEDRQRRGLVLEFSVAENIALHDYEKPPYARLGWLFPRRFIERARTLIREFDVRGGGPLTRAGGLSGGNQQKVVAAREISRDPKVLIAAQPTRGLDVGAIEYLHRRIVNERDKGRAVLLVSLELEEIFSLSDRILVIYEGEIVGEHTGEVSEQELGLEMLGGREQAVA
ncbi:MAG: ral nucleoside transport system ATP-binding protein [Gaiellaceae bacterium]|nr:ral nucleoside transport system ATP-binding protein [Gaiellaceae bacterium]